MKLSKRIRTMAITSAVALFGAAPVAWAGAEHSEFAFTVNDWNDCTGEVVHWDVWMDMVALAMETPSGQGIEASLTRWEGTVEGLSTGYLWTSKGQSPVISRYSLENSLTGGFLAIENSVLKPVTPGAPMIKLDVHIQFAYNAAGELVVDKAVYTYDCR